MTADTWKQIAAAVGRSVRWCQQRAVAAVNPLPVFKLGGRARLRLRDLERWLSRERAISLRAQKRAGTRRNAQERAGGSPRRPAR